ncbi:unnamed protein product [Protopolystoma xenopodis]|uniref:Uncharacterized protein n=1 Tax=Protopolystoma xenopodis TaxID=117903 RepID=A0A3S4ZHH9_9PLAT|nr:unnamed protein product [Protopolystoma xenopodis]
MQNRIIRSRQLERERRTISPPEQNVDGRNVNRNSANQRRRRHRDTSASEEVRTPHSYSTRKYANAGEDDRNSDMYRHAGGGIKSKSNQNVPIATLSETVAAEQRKDRQSSEGLTAKKNAVGCQVGPSKRMVGEINLAIVGGRSDSEMAPACRLESRGRRDGIKGMDRNRKNQQKRKESNVEDSCIAEDVEDEGTNRGEKGDELEGEAEKEEELAVVTTPAINLFRLLTVESVEHAEAIYRASKMREQDQKMATKGGYI